MRVVRGHWGANGGGAELQQKRRATCRHEANGHIRTKQEDDQQKAGHQVAPAIVEKALPHVLVASECVLLKSIPIQGPCERGNRV